MDIPNEDTFLAGIDMGEGRGLGSPPPPPPHKSGKIYIILLDPEEDDVRM